MDSAMNKLPLQWHVVIWTSLEPLQSVFYLLYEPERLWSKVVAVHLSWSVFIVWERELQFPATTLQLVCIQSSCTETECMYSSKQNNILFVYLQFCTHVCISALLLVILLLIPLLFLITITSFDVCCLKLCPVVHRKRVEC